MSQKTQLPGTILDAVAGGIFPIEGQPVTDLSITDDGTSVTCVGQTASHSWSADKKKDILSNPQYFGVFKDMTAGLQASSTKYDLEETMEKLA